MNANHKKCLLSPPLTRTSRGSLIVENMMAMLIFSAGVSGLFSLDSRLIAVNRESSEYVTASTLARNTLEDLHRRDPEAYAASPVNGQIGPLNSAGQASASGRYYVAWAYAAETPHPGMNQVNINISWIDATNHNKSLAFASAIRTPRLMPVSTISGWSGSTAAALAHYGNCPGH